MLLFSAFVVGALHALAPDHWLPFVALSRAQSWSTRKTALVTFVAGIIHVCSSLILGLAGISLQRSLAEVIRWEGLRGEWFSFLLIGFGLIYMLWAFKQSNKKKIEEMRSRENEIVYWIYFSIFVLGPCEPLIPFLFLSVNKGAAQMFPVVMFFGAATLMVMTAAACAALRGFERIKLPKTFALNPGVAAGAKIDLTLLAGRILCIG